MYTCTRVRVPRAGTDRLSWLLRKQTKERNEGRSALGGPAPLFMVHCICWPRIAHRCRPVWSHLASDFTFDSLLANGSCISIRRPYRRGRVLCSRIRHPLLRDSSMKMERAIRLPATLSTFGYTVWKRTTIDSRLIGTAIGEEIAMWSGVR